MNVYNKIASGILAISLAVTMVGCSGIPTIRGVTDTSSNWEIAITSLKVVDAEEDNSILGVVPLSDGDEPYIIMIGFHSTFGNTQVTDVRENVIDDYQWTKDHYKAGQKMTVPVKMGVMRFQDVGKRDVIGVVVIAMEADRSPKQLIQRMIQLSKEQMQAVVEWSVESQSMDAFQSPSIVQELHRSMQEAIAPIEDPQTASHAIQNIVFSGGDRDEVIGINSLIFMPQAPSDELTYPQYRSTYLTDVLRSNEQNAPLIFKNNRLEATYEAELRVREFGN